LFSTIQFMELTYMRVSNFGRNIDSKMTIRLMRGSTYTQEYTVLNKRGHLVKASVEQRRVTGRRNSVMTIA
jgi:hypothetical protein